MFPDPLGIAGRRIAQAGHIGVAHVGDNTIAVPLAQNIARADPVHRHGFPILGQGKVEQQLAIRRHKLRGAIHGAGIGIIVDKRLRHRISGRHLRQGNSTLVGEVHQGLLGVIRPPTITVVRVQNHTLPVNGGQLFGNIDVHNQAIADGTGTAENHRILIGIGRRRAVRAERGEETGPAILELTPRPAHVRQGIAYLVTGAKRRQAPGQKQNYHPDDEAGAQKVEMDVTLITHGCRAPPFLLIDQMGAGHVK